MNINSDVKIGYFQVPGENKYVCVALQRPPKGSTRRNYTASFSFYSKEHEFSPYQDKGGRTFLKAQARETAIGRLLKGKAVAAFELTPEQDQNLCDVFLTALKESTKVLHTKVVRDLGDRARSYQCHLAPPWLSTAIESGKLVFGLTQAVKEEAQPA